MSGKKELKGGKANNTGSPHNGDDILLKTRVAKSVQVKDPRPSSHRVEMQILYLNKDSENLIMETLKHIHGPQFVLKHRPFFREKSGNLNKQYWIGRGNLVVQGGIDFSAKNKEHSENDIINLFAVSKLERYGFHKSHCLEALEITQGDVGTALELLQNQYFNLDVKFPTLKLPQSSEEEDEEPAITSKDPVLLALREEEKSALESIYENLFEERISNKVWIINLDLEYLLNFHKPHEEVDDWDIDKIQPKPKSKTEMCSFYAKGSCKYGHNCRFSHRPISPLTVVEKPEKHLFQLEIRFGDGSNYPREVPFVFLTTNAPKFPSEACMRISYHLIQEAKTYAVDDSPCVFSLAQILLDDHGRIGNVLLSENYTLDGLFLEPNRPLFPPLELEEVLMDEDTVEVKKSFKRLPRAQINMDDLLRQDAIIARKFKEDQSNARYRRVCNLRRELPAWPMREDILHTVANHQVVVISGETGCGKSTQVPQYILDNWLKHRSADSHVEIICTQPRRISAIGVAERVADERVERVGNTVGYQIRLESKTSSSTRLLFCTTGILLRRLEGDSTLANVTHVIVDEVHERSEESDFLLLILRDLLPVRPDLKVILMSATLNAQLFSEYFDGAPTLEIPGRTHPVEQYFLEDAVEMSGHVVEENSTYARRNVKWKRGDEDLWETELQTAELRAEVLVPPKTPDESLNLRQMMSRYADYSSTTIKSLFLMDPNKIDYDLIESVLMWIVEGDHDYPREGSILVFLPGMAEISTLHDQLSAHPVLSPNTGKFKLVPLHSTLSSEEQAAVFKRPSPGCRKIVISTNIAETSVTIDDCVFVVDAGKMKEKRFDSNKNMESLDLCWVSRANAMQRKGRAGRVMPGVCIHLFTEQRYRWMFLAQPIPELHRVPLEQLLLRIKTLPNFAERDPHSVLSGTIEPPAPENIDSALLRLRDVGALDKNMALTPLGRHLAALPVDVRVGKLMLFGAIFCCVDSALTIAACLSHKSPFVAPFAKKDSVDIKKKEFATGNSDQLTVLRAYQKWHSENARSRFAGKNFAHENFLSYRVLQTLGDIKQQFLELLASIGFVDGDVCRGRRGSGNDDVRKITGDALNVNGDNPRLLSAMLCAALYPNVVKIMTPEKSFEASAGGAIPKDFSAVELKFKTKDDGYVNLHPSSVLYSVSNYASPYLVYQEKVKTSRIYIRDCSMAHMIPLILFAGSTLKVEMFQGMFVLALEDGWIKFGVDSHDIAELLFQIRLELVKLLEEKIEDPTLNLLTHDHGKKIISTIVHLLT